MTAPANQLLLMVRPGYCQRCGILKLSSANTDGICDSCGDEQARVTRWAQRGNLCKCGRGPKQSYGVCRECHRQYARDYRRKLKLKKDW